MRKVEETKAEYADCLNCKRGFNCLGILSDCPKPLNIEHYHFEYLRTVTQGIPLDRLSEICAAEKDGRCVIMPCKVGAICYEIDPGHTGAIKHTVTGTTVYNRQEDGNRYMTDFVNVIIIDTWAVAEDGCEWADQYTVAEWADAPKTRPEAEAALKGDAPNE